MDDTINDIVDPAKIRSSFDMAATGYDSVAALQREINKRLISRLNHFKINPQVILDLGAGTGTGSRLLQRHYKKVTVCAVDFAYAMLARLQKKNPWWRKPLPVCAGIDALPFKDNSVDLIYSSLTFQWCQDLPELFAECRRVLKPGGAMLFATLGPDTLRELRTSWAAADADIHVNPFVDMHDIGDCLLAQGFADPVMDIEYITMVYPSVMALMRELKKLGANTVIGPRNKGLTGKGKLRKVCQAYEKFRSNAMHYPATYEIVYGVAWERQAVTRPLKFVSKPYIS